MYARLALSRLLRGATNLGSIEREKPATQSLLGTGNRRPYNGLFLLHDYDYAESMQ